MLSRRRSSGSFQSRPATFLSAWPHQPLPSQFVTRLGKQTQPGNADQRTSAIRTEGGAAEQEVQPPINRCGDGLLQNLEQEREEGRGGGKRESTRIHSLHTTVVWNPRRRGRNEGSANGVPCTVRINRCTKHVVGFPVGRRQTNENSPGSQRSRPQHTDAPVCT